MRLRALDQIHVSSVKSDSLRPGEEFSVADDLGAALMKQNPTAFEEIAGDGAGEAPASTPDNKMAPPAKTKPAPRPRTKQAKTKATS